MSDCHLSLLQHPGNVESTCTVQWVHCHLHLRSLQHPCAKNSWLWQFVIIPFASMICQPFFWYFSLRCSFWCCPSAKKGLSTGTPTAPHHITTGIPVMYLLLWAGTDTQTGSGVPLAVRIFSHFGGMVSPWQDKYVYRKMLMISEVVISASRVLTGFQRGPRGIPCWKIHSQDGSSRAGACLPKAALWRAI